MYHHVHIGGGFVLLSVLSLCLLILAITAPIMIGARSKRNSAERMRRLSAEIEESRARRVERRVRYAEDCAGGAQLTAHRVNVSGRPGQTAASSPRGFASRADDMGMMRQASPVAPSSPVVVQSGSSATGLVEGLVIGDLLGSMGHDRSEIVTEHTIESVSPSWDPIPTGDSGGGFFSFDSSPSYDCGGGSSFDSGGSFDCSF
ncbi:hypothetical protein [Neoasaia chiangmaiensis]|uniref:Uncharacterized protein n=1 Tax=Neoasaia chiangmaiensis TaxID=320497 RepID=A0A1U9KR05_9PROT|nr:hypothetical protein [Neoasaia chiangmaiensis]AQS88258.1 hypothetical protein A0U93_10255 [Neoasaia chiangmaiensis]